MTLNALEVVARAVARPVIRAAAPASNLSLDDWIEMMTLDNVPYLNTTLKPDQEQADGSFLSLIQSGYRSNGVIFACLMTRFLLFSEARFAYQQMFGNRPGNLFGTPSLSILEHPGPGRTTADLLARMMLDNDLAGIWYGLLQAGEIKRLRPDWTGAVFGSKRKDATPQDPDASLAGFAFQPGGPSGKAEVMTFLPEQVAWFTTVPDALRNLVGMPWLTPVLKNLMSDNAAANFKLAYFRNAATPNLMVMLPPTMSKEKAEEWIELFDQEHRGALNSFKTIYFGGGVTAQKIGADLGEIDLRKVQAGDETRIIAAAGLHPSLFGLGDIQSGGLNTGNMPAIVRWIADSTMRPSWRNAAGSLGELLGTPGPSVRMWYDDRDVPFLRDDVRDSARATQLHGATIGGLINNGFLPDDAVDAVTSSDLTRLIGKHSGLVSVQLQSPGSSSPTIPDGSSTDGSAAGATVVRTHLVSVATLRDMLASGYRAATTTDDEVVRAALTSGSGGTLVGAIEAVRAAIGGAERVRTRASFWPSDGPFAELGEIPKGVELPGEHQLVRSFPAMFESVAVTSDGVRCPSCKKRIAEKLGPGSRLRCRWCKREVTA